MELSPFSADDVARERFEKYLKERTAKERSPFIWQFYTYLLTQAKKYRTSDVKPFDPSYMADHIEALKNLKS